MSHFTVLVIGKNVEEQLAPYQEGVLPGQEVENPNAKWDWYGIGGRWNGFFKLKKELKGEASVGAPGALRKSREDYSGRADQALKCDIDFEGIREDAGKEAGDRYDTVVKIFNGRIPKIQFLWKTIMDEDNPQFNHMSRDERVKFYWGQSALIELKETREHLKGLSKEEEELLCWFDLDEYQVIRYEYVELAKRYAISTFAVVKDGKWYEQGQMGWFACVSNEKDQSSWEEELEDILNTVPEDEWLTLVDCHI
jgi:hypothetical protein